MMGLKTCQYEALTDFLITAAAGELMDRADLLARAIPELAPMIGFNQHSPHHAYDLFGHTARVTAAVPREPVLRWAALLHDTGKVDTFTRDATGRGHFYGHPAAGAKHADAILRRLEAPADLREQVVFLIENHMKTLQPHAESLKTQMAYLGKQRLWQLLELQQADNASKGVDSAEEIARFRKIRELLAELCDGMV